MPSQLPCGATKKDGKIKPMANAQSFSMWGEHWSLILPSNRTANMLVKCCAWAAGFPLPNECSWNVHSVGSACLHGSFPPPLSKAKGWGWWVTLNGTLWNDTATWCTGVIGECEQVMHRCDWWAWVDSVWIYPSNRANDNKEYLECYAHHSICKQFII